MVTPQRSSSCLQAPRSSYSEPLPPPGQTVDAPPPTSTPPKSQPGPPTHDHILRAKHVLLGFLALCVGVIGSAMITSMTSNIAFRWALFKVSRRVLQSVAFRNTLGIMALVCLVRYGLEPIARLISRFLNRGAVSWQESNEHFILQQIYRPLELLIITAAISTVGENLLPSLIAIPKDLVRQVIRTSLSLTFVIMSARIVFSIKGKLVGDAARQFEFQGNDPARRRVEAVDKLVTVLVLFVALVLGLQAVGLDINSVLAISGFGGLALGLAGREILENLFNGLLIVSSRSFLVGEEVVFYPGNRMVEGIVVDIGWYRTLIRSFEREIFVIPNSVFSRTVVLNVTRKNKEWRFKESIGLEVADVDKAAAIVADMRKVVRQDPRVLQKLHRRVFLDDISRDEVRIFMSFYVDAANRDAFMAIKQDLLLAFISIVQRNGASLARNYLQLKVTDMPESLSQSLVRGANGQQRSSFPTAGGSSGSSQGGGGSAGGDGTPPAVLVTKVVENQADSTVEVSTTSTAVAARAAARPAPASPLHSAPTSVTPGEALPAHAAAAGGPDRRVRMQGSPQDAADSAAAAPPMGVGGGGAWGASTLTQQEPGGPPPLRSVGDVDT